MRRILALAALLLACWHGDGQAQQPAQAEPPSAVSRKALEEEATRLRGVTQNGAVRGQGSAASAQQQPPGDARR